MVSGFCFGLGYILMSQISEIWQLYLVYGAVGIGLGGTVVPLTSTVLRWFSTRRNMMTGIAMSGSGIGLVVSSPLANGLVALYDWRNTYLILGIFVLVTIMLLAQLLKSGRNVAGTSSSSVSRGLKVINFSIVGGGIGLALSDTRHS